MRASRVERVTTAQSVTRPAGAFPGDPKIRSRTLLIWLLVGVTLLWPGPLAGALLMVATSFGLPVSGETEPGGAGGNTTLVEPVFLERSAPDPTSVVNTRSRALTPDH